MGVVMAYPSGGHPEYLFGACKDRLLLHDKNIVDIISVNSSRLASNRNAMAARFMERYTEPWLWMVDDDMTFPVDVVERLVAAATANQALIVGGLCFGGGRAGTCFPTLYQLTPPDENGEVVKVVEDYPEDAMVKVDGTGAACLLIHRSALQRIADTFGKIESPKGSVTNPSPWFAETSYYGKEFGEDWTFCLRAAQCGIDVFVHTGIKLGHIKTLVMDEHHWRDYVATRERLGGKDAVLAQYLERTFA